MTEDANGLSLYSVPPANADPTKGHYEVFVPS